MPFVTFPGLPGRVYVPGEDPGSLKKHGCADCFHCQMCSDDRCGLCRARAGPLGRKPPARVQPAAGEAGGPEAGPAACREGK